MMKVQNAPEIFIKTNGGSYLLKRRRSKVSALIRTVRDKEEWSRVMYQTTKGMKIEEERRREEGGKGSP